MKKCKGFLSAVLAGICISVGGAVFLSVDNKVLGAFLFSVGLFTICTMGFSLFTGKVCYVFENDGKYALQLIFIWLGNLLGTWVTAMALHGTRIGAALSEKAVAACTVKLNDSLLSVFLLAVFCNIMIYFAVESYRKNPHEIGKYLGLIFGVMVFILCGFEHCVANMFYLSVAGLWSGKALLFILINTAGNALGGVFIPLVRRIIQ